MYRQILSISTGFILVCFVCICWIDRPLAAFIQANLPHVGKTISPILSAIETVFGFPVSKYLLGFIGLLIGLILYLIDKNVNRANLFFFIALTHMVSRLTAGVLKNVFLRLRPYEFLASGNEANDFWINGGSSFPSGHTVHFFGLFLPLIFCYPNQKWWLILPVFIGLSRILANDHYLSDVIASVYIAYFFTYIFAHTLKMRNKEVNRFR